jgi:hypothetical protein
MTKLLEEVIQQLSDLPEEEQNAAADVLFAYISSDERQYALRPRPGRRDRRIRDKLRYGTTRLATPHEVATARRNAAL